MQLKTLFIDWDGTLSNSKFWENCDNPKLPPQIIQAFTEYLFRDAHNLVSEWMRGFRSSATIVTVLADVFGLDGNLLYDELRKSCERMRLVDSTIPSLVQKIRAKGTKVVIATDNMDTFQNWTVAALGLDEIFDGVLDSPSRGSLKADIDNGYSPFFGLYLSQQGVKPHESILIDNSENNRAIESIGIDFKHINGADGLLNALNGIAQ